jgi:hypothetical protein
LISFDQSIYSLHSIYQKIQTRKFFCLLFTNIYQGGDSSQLKLVSISLKGPFFGCAGITNAKTRFHLVQELILIFLTPLHYCLTRKRFRESCAGPNETYLDII